MRGLGKFVGGGGFGVRSPSRAMASKRVATSRVVPLWLPLFASLTRLRLVPLLLPTAVASV